MSFNTVGIFNYNYTLAIQPKNSLWLTLFVCDYISLVSKSLGQKQLTAPFKAEDDLLGHTITQGPKTVDVPASLPTPPHNNQEELR